MTKDDVQHLAHLARIAVSDSEAETFTTEIDAILAYVSEVTEVAGTEAVTPKVGAVYNVFRKDEVTTTPGAFTDQILASMPETDGRFMSVKKILNQDD